MAGFIHPWVDKKPPNSNGTVYNSIKNYKNFLRIPKRMYASHGNAKLYLRNRLTSTIVFSEIKFWIIRGAANGKFGVFLDL